MLLPLTQSVTHNNTANDTYCINHICDQQILYCRKHHTDKNRLFSAIKNEKLDNNKMK